MRGVVLAAGEGTRLRPLTAQRPKVMLPVARRPVIRHVVEALAEARIRDLVVVVGYKGETVQSYLGDGSRFGVDITYAHQPRQIGTADALAHAEDHVDEPFLVVAGDNIVAAEDLEAVADVEDAPALLVHRSDAPGRYGNVLLEDGVVREIVEKPAETVSDIVSTFVYRFTPRVFDVIRDRAEAGHNDITSVVNAMTDQGEKIRAVRGTVERLDVVYPWDLIDVNARVLDQEEGVVEGRQKRNVVLEGRVSIGRDTTIHPGTVIQGPVTIGEGCEIGPHAVIEPATSIGDGVTVGPHSVVRNSVVMDRVQAGPGCVVEDSVLAEGARLGSQVSLTSGAARVIRQEQVGGSVEDRVHEIDPLGAVVAEDAVLASQVSVAPGVQVGAGATVAAGVSVREDVPDGGKVV